jgi:hypothetical protein
VSKEGLDITGADFMVPLFIFSAFISFRIRSDALMSPLEVLVGLLGHLLPF